MTAAALTANTSLPGLQYDPELDSLEDCQQKCQDQWNCDFFTYEWEMVGGEMVYKCYLKAAYDNGNEACNDDVWCDWSNSDAYAATGWHSGSGPKFCTAKLDPRPICDGPLSDPAGTLTIEGCSHPG